jgi:hypothetical protein
MTKLKNEKGYMLVVKNAAQVFFDKIDKSSIDQLVINNSTWFENDLFEEDIRQMFKPSYCSQNNTVNIFLPSEICLDIPNVQEYLCHTSGKVLNIKIHHMGMYVYPEQTVNRWVAKSINIHSIDDVHMTETKEDIEAYWLEQVQRCNEMLDTKIQNIKEIQAKVHSEYSAIVAEKFSNKNWECKIRDLQSLIQNIIF